METLPSVSLGRPNENLAVLSNAGEKTWLSDSVADWLRLSPRARTCGNAVPEATNPRFAAETALLTWFSSMV